MKANQSIMCPFTCSKAARGMSEIGDGEDI